MIDRARLFRAYWELERRIAPGLDSSQAHYEAVLRRYVSQATRWLDLGCGRHLLPEWRRDAERELIGRAAAVAGVDLDFDSLRDNKSVPFLCRSSVGELPFAPASFSLVTANMVMEHVDAPATVLRELHRVLVPGGHLVFHTPNAGAFPTVVARLLPDRVKRYLAQILDGRESKDVFPTHYRANRPGEIRRQAAETGFEVTELHLVSTNAVFALVPPLAALELLWIRSLRTPDRAHRRSNIIAVLTRT